MGTSNSVSLAGVVAAALLLYGAYWLIVYPSFLSPFSKIPAARWHARYCPLWSYYIKWAQVENATALDLHKKHGPVVLLGPSELSINSYEGVKIIYGGGFPKPDWYYNRFANYG